MKNLQQYPISKKINSQFWTRVREYKLSASDDAKNDANKEDKNKSFWCKQGR